MLQKHSHAEPVVIRHPVSEGFAVGSIANHVTNCQYPLLLDTKQLLNSTLCCDRLWTLPSNCSPHAARPCGCVQLSMLLLATTQQPSWTSGASASSSQTIQV